MNRFFKNLNASQVVSIGFILIMAVGTAVLTLPVSSASGEMTNPIDALFTAASAVCITGLSVVSTASHWSIIGQITILLLIQIGGLGFMCFVTLVFSVLGKKMTIKEKNVVQETYSLENMNYALKFSSYIISFSLAAEFIGAIILSMFFLKGNSPISSVYYGIFHSVSAFCNAGFDILGENSLCSYSGTVIVNITVSALIIIGGIGFPVVLDLYNAAVNIFLKRLPLSFSLKRLRLHTKLVLVSTFLLIFIPALIIFAAEYSNPATMGNMSLKSKILSSFFQSVTTRTAGFATIEQGSMSYISKLISIFCMFVGGSPAGTAGGTKTVTISLLIISTLCLIKGSDELTSFNRKISFETLQKAIAVVTMMLIIILLSVIILSISEADKLAVNGGSFELLDIVYEVVSAIATVGLTTGLTPVLSPVGKLVIIICMFIGRIGPISLAISLTARSKKNLIHYPEEKLIVG